MMNIFQKTTLQNLKKNRTRTLVTIIGVILSTAMLTAVITFGHSLLNYMLEGAIQKYGDWEVEVLNASHADIERLAENQEVSEIGMVQNMGYSQLEKSENSEKPYLFVTGFSEQAFEMIPINLLSGRLPQNTQELLISGKTGVDGSYKIGDQVTLKMGERLREGQSIGQEIPYSSAIPEEIKMNEEKTYTIVGICQRPSFEETTAAGHTAITLADFSVPAQSLSAFIRLKDPYQTKTFITNNLNKQQYVTNNNVLRFMGISDDHLFNVFLYTLGSIVILIVMIGAVFLIYNAFTISLNERTQQFGILASVGATPKQLRNSVLFEGLCIGVLGIPFGIVVGIGCVWLILSVVSQSFQSFLYSGVSLELSVSILGLLAAVVVSLLTILISAYLPAKKAANTPVMENIRQTNDVQLDSRSVKISRFAARLYGLEGMLALKNFKRNRKRYRSVILSLSLSIVLFIAGNAFGATLKEASKQIVEVTDYDLAIVLADTNQEQLTTIYNQIKKIEGVKKIASQMDVSYQGRIQSKDFSQAFWKETDQLSESKAINVSLTLQFLDEESYEKLLKTAEVDLSKGEIAAVAAMKDDAASQLFNQAKVNIQLLPEISAPSSNDRSQEAALVMVQLVPPDTLPVLTTTVENQEPYLLRLFLPISAQSDFVRSAPSTQEVTGLTINSDTPSVTAAKIEGELQKLGFSGKYTVYNMAKMLEENQSMIFISRIFTYVFVAMLSLIAVANVFNTISTSIRLRRRELAMLRSIGMSDRDFYKMMNFECFFYGLKAILFGVPLGIGASILIYFGMKSAGADGIHYLFPWGSVLLCIVSVFLIIFITMFYVTHQISKENIIDAIRDEMT